MGDMMGRRFGKNANKWGEQRRGEGKMFSLMLAGIGIWCLRGKRVRWAYAIPSGMIPGVFPFFFGIFGFVFGALLLGSYFRINLQT